VTKRKPGNEGGVYLRGETWWIRYCGPRRDGTWGEIRESAADTRAKAEKVRKERLLGVENHKRGIRKFQGPQQEKATVGELLDNLQRDHETRRLKAIRETKNHIKPVREFFGFDRAVRVTTARIEDYIAHRREEDDAADATIDNETGILHRAFKLAAEAGLVAWVPKVPRLVKGHANAREGFVERAQHERILPELPSQVLRDWAIWAYGTGMRFGSMQALTWSGYNRETGTFRLPHKSSKTGRGLVLKLQKSPELAGVIERRLADRMPGCDLVFHRRGQRVGEFYTTWCRALERAKLPHFTIHDYRRTAVHNMVAAGIPERVAMAISGHLTRAIFDRYNIVQERDLDDAMEKRTAYEATLPVGENVGRVASIAEAGSHIRSTS
jgi:integrase